MTLSPLRAGRITASRVPAILGLSPYQTRADVLRAMVREAMGAESEFQGNVATRHGQAFEEDALADVERQLGIMLTPGECIVHPEHRFLAATPDALVGDDGLVECKAPYRAAYTHYNERPDYQAQMQHQMAVSGRAWCLFVVWRQGETHVSRLERDPDWLDRHLPALVEFHAEYRAALEAPDPHLQPLVVERSDPEWQAAVDAYRDSVRARDDADAALHAARDKLIALAGERNSAGAGVRVTRVERKGAVDYRAVPALKGVDLEQYRKPGTEYWTVSEIKS